MLPDSYTTSLYCTEGDSETKPCSFLLRIFLPHTASTFLIIQTFSFIGFHSRSIPSPDLHGANSTGTDGETGGNKHVYVCMRQRKREWSQWESNFHTLWFCSPWITAVCIWSLLPLLIAYCFLQSWWGWVVGTKRRASQEYQRKYKSLFNLLSVCQICKWVWDHLGCDCTCSVIRNLRKLLYSVSQHQLPQRSQWETINQVFKSFKTCYLLFALWNY